MGAVRRPSPMRWLAVASCAVALLALSLLFSPAVEHPDDELPHECDAAVPRLCTRGGPRAERALLPARQAYERHNEQRSSSPSSGSYQADGCGVDDDDDTFGYYHDYTHLTRLVQTLGDRTKHPHACYFKLSEQTHDGRELWVLRVGAAVSTYSATEPGGTLECDKIPALENVPQIKYVGNMHGDEVIGRENCLRYAHALVSCYNVDSSVKAWLNTVDVYILPSMNPDGYEHLWRGNGNRVDLNRDFPDPYELKPYGLKTIDQLIEPSTQQPETRAIMWWLQQVENRFVLSINYHGGAVVANYPYDGAPRGSRQSGTNVTTPDNDLFIDLAMTYSHNNPAMLANPEFRPNGITNGADWYSLYGGMQDFNYVFHGCLELTVELSNIKWPSSSVLRSMWLDNKMSMLKYQQYVNSGVRGVVNCYSNSTGTTGPCTSPVKVYLQLSGKYAVGDPQLERPIYAHRQTNWYYRLLTKGVHTLRVESEDCRPEPRTIAYYGDSILREDFVLQCE